MTENFDSQRTLQVIGQHFGPLPGRAVAAPARLALPVSALTTQVRSGDVRWVALAYPQANATDDSDIALIPLANMFAAEPHGRLYLALVVADKSLGVLAQPLSFRRGGYLLFAAPLRGGQSMDEDRQIVAEQLEGLARQPIRDEEVQRFQSNWKPIKAQLLSNPVALADSLSENVALGDWQLLLKAHEGFTRLSTSEVQRQAQEHFQAGRRLVAELHPADAQQARVSAAPPTAVRPSTQTQVTALPDAVDLAAFAAKVASVESRIQRSSLDNGLKLALRPLRAAGRPLEGGLNLRFGDVHSLAGKNVLADLTATLLLRGTHNRSYQQIVDQINAMGAGLVIQPQGSSLLRVGFTVPAPQLAQMLELIADIVQNPASPRSEVNLIKRQWQSGWMMPLGQPAEVAALHLNLHAAPWPVGDMRRHVEPRQRLAVLKRLSRDDVQAFHRDFYGANHGEFALSGDFDAHALRQQLQRLFGAWNSHSDYARAPQTGHYLGRLHFDLNARASPEDNPALFVAEHILGRKPLVSRLSHRLREREKLSYEIRSSLKVATFDNASWLTIQADYLSGDGQRLADIAREELHV